MSRAHFSLLPPAPGDTHMKVVVMVGVEWHMPRQSAEQVAFTAHRAVMQTRKDKEEHAAQSNPVRLRIYSKALCQIT